MSRSNFSYLGPPNSVLETSYQMCVRPPPFSGGNWSSFSTVLSLGHQVVTYYFYQFSKNSCGLMQPLFEGGRYLCNLTKKTAVEICIRIKGFSFKYGIGTLLIKSQVFRNNTISFCLPCGVYKVELFITTNQVLTSIGQLREVT
jgi:hypothetical protein